MLIAEQKVRPADIARLVALALVLAVAACGRSDHQRLGVCVISDININDLKAGTCLEPDQIAALMDAPVHLASGKIAAFNMTSPDLTKPQEQVTTCGAYEAHKAGNWYAMTGVDMAMEGWFQRACGTLEFLAKASPAKKSYLDKPDSGLSDPKLINAAILPPSPNSNQPSGQGSIADRIADGTVRINSATKTRLDLTYGNQTVVYNALARGDFDHDGVQDLLVFISVHAVGGTMKWYELITLSRSSARGLLEPVHAAQ